MQIIVNAWPLFAIALELHYSRKTREEELARRRLMWYAIK